MRSALIPILLAAAMPGAAFAQERPAAVGMECREAQALVLARGAVVLGTGPNGYDRIVRDQSFCELETTTAPVYLPTRDAPQCFVGYRCRDLNRGESRSSG